MSLGPYTTAAELTTEDLEKGSLRAISRSLCTNGLVLELFKLKYSCKKFAELLYDIAPDSSMRRTVPAEAIRKKIVDLKKKLTKIARNSKKHKVLLDQIFILFDGLPMIGNEEGVGEHVSSSVPTLASFEVQSTEMPVGDSDSTSVEVENTQLPVGDSDSTCMEVGNIQMPVGDLDSPCSVVTCEVTKTHNILLRDISLKRKHLAVLDELYASKQSKMGRYSIRNVNKRDKRAQETISKITASMKQLKTTETATTKQKKGKKKLKVKLGLQRTEIGMLKRKVRLLSKRLHSHRSCVPLSKYKQMKRELTVSNQFLEVQVDKQQDKNLCIDLCNEKGYTIETRMLVTELTGLEVAQSKIPAVIEAVARNLFGTSVQKLPDAKTIRNINDEGHYLAKKFIAEKLDQSKSIGCGRDGTTRKHVKILDTSLISDDGSIMSVGFTEVASETSDTIAYIFKGHIEELSSMLPIPEEGNKLCDLVEHLTFCMSDRAANEKKSNRLIAEWRSEVLLANKRPVVEVQNFYCMAHVLLGMHKNLIDEVKSLQVSLETNEKLGRDKLEVCKNFFWESVFTRVPRVASSIFDPVGDFLGMRDVWDIHCAQNGFKSRIGQYKDNRFNGLFETSAQVLYHIDDFVYLLQYRTSNKKLKSIQADLQDPTVVTLVQAMAILFIQITGPYWNIMEKSDIPYVNLGPTVIQPLLAFVDECTNDPLPLFGDGPDCLIPYKDNIHEIYHRLLEPLHPECVEILYTALKLSCKAIAKTLRKQANDFLPGGKYAELASADLVKRTGFSQNNNNGCEHHFGDLDSSQRRRPNCSMHHHSTVQMLKRNREAIKKWYSAMPPIKQQALWKEARERGKQLRAKHRKDEAEQRHQLYVKTVSSETLKKNKKKQVNSDYDSLPNEEFEKENPFQSPAATELKKLVPSDQTITEGLRVSVAYQDNWYPGVVTEDITSQQHFKVNFYARTSNPRHFKAPNGKDVQTVEHKFLLAPPGDAIPVNGGRAWALEKADDVERAYQLFTELYF